MSNHVVSITWSEFLRDVPDIGKVVLDVFRSHPHHVIATIKPDGSPRVGGTNVQFTNDHMWIGAMPRAYRVSDLMRESRCSIHSAPLDEHLQRPDVQLDAIAELAGDTTARALLSNEVGAHEGKVFLLKICSVRVLRVNGEELHVDSWNPSEGQQTRLINQ